MSGFQDTFNLLLEFTEIQMPKIFNKLKEIDDPLAGVHFTNQNNVSINYSPIHRDPVGVYAFPKHYVLSKQLQNHSYFISMKNVFIIKPKKGIKILDLSRVTKQEATKILTNFGIDAEKYNLSENIGKKMWYAIKGELEDQMQRIPAIMNRKFRDMGYDAIYDPGLAIIHSNEKSQIAYLSHRAYEVVDSFINNPTSIINYLRKEFPTFKVIKNNKEKSYSLTYKFHDKTAGRYFEISVPIQYPFSVSLVLCDSTRKHIYSDTEMDDIVNIINQSFSKCSPNQYKEQSTPPIISDIAKTYNFSIKENDDSITRNYLDKANNSKLLINISYYAGDYHRKRKLQINMRRANNISHYSSMLDYYVYTHITDLDGTPEKITERLLDELEKVITEHTYLDEFKKQKALSDLTFLRKRVFIKR